MRCALLHAGLFQAAQICNKLRYAAVVLRCVWSQKVRCFDQSGIFFRLLVLADPGGCGAEKSDNSGVFLRLIVLLESLVLLIIADTGVGGA